MQTPRAPLAMLFAATLLLPAVAQQPPSNSANPCPLILIGFLGGNVPAGNMSRPEERLAHDLQQRFPNQLHAAVFADHDANSALRTVLTLLDPAGRAQPTAPEKRAARIVLYGHSWGASEAITFARRLNDLHIPVLLTIQIDSVQKRHEDDRDIPSNVLQAVNFYQTGGLVHGRRFIVATDPAHTTILGDYRFNYRGHAVPTPGYSWLVRTVMHKHIEMENDPAVWSRVTALIQAQLH